MGELADDFRFIKEVKAKERAKIGAICGGVVKESEFWKEPMGYMMAYVMPDDKFEEYQKLKDEDWESKEAKKLFDEFAWSAI